MEWKYLSFDQLNQSLIEQYRKTVLDAFPAVIHHSNVIKKYWPLVENYFPKHQVFAIDNNALIGIINTVPFYWISPLVNCQMMVGIG